MENFSKELTDLGGAEGRNETTASQPKASDYHGDTIFDGSVGQPKSIGDDAIRKQILEIAARIFDFKPHKQTLETNGKYFDFAEGVIDNFHAPAAQASATIQAAPIGWAAKRVDGMGYGSFLYSNRQSAEIAISHNGPAAPKYEIAPVFAATIQEPVMVAEPVAWYADTTYDLNEDKQGDWPVELRSHRAFVFGAKRPTSKWDWKPLGDLSELAAPMVADPAGVIVAEIGDPLLLSKEAFISSLCYRLYQSEISSYRKVIEIAATVNAVPSEALDPSEVQTIAERIRNSNFAAPLADKTGGGE